MKRLFDVVAGLAGLVVTSPVWALAAVAIKLTSRGPVLHRATRIGRDGEPFTLYKFRSMRPGEGPAVTASGDPRITTVGRLLRRTKLDELPQLLNVLRGEMSVVGPRPEDPSYVATYTDEQRRVLSVRPGLTSPAAIAFRHEERLLAGAADPERHYLEEILPRKLELDLAYLERASVVRDVAIALRTLGAIVRGGSS